MTVTIDLMPDLDRRLRQLAQASGLAIETYLVELIENTLPGQRHEAAVELLSRWSEEDRTQDPDEIEVRRGDWERFLAAPPGELPEVSSPAVWRRILSATSPAEVGNER